MKIARLFLYFVIITGIVGAVFFYSWIAQYLIGAILFTYIFNPWINWLEKHYVPRLFGIFIVYAVIGLIVTWGVITFFPILINQAENLLELIQNPYRKGEISLLNVDFVRNLQLNIIQIDNHVPILKLNDNFVKLITQLNHTLMDIPGLLINNYQRILEALSLIATIPIIGFFLLKDNYKFRKDFLSLIPNRYFEITLILMHKVDEIIGKYLRAMVYEIIIVGGLSAIVLSFLGINYAVLIGFLAGLANIIPYLGPFMGVLFAISSILISGSPPILILYVIIAMYLIQVLDNNIVYPYVVGTTIEMHPLMVLLTVIAGGWAWGLFGMLVSVPLVYLIYNVIKVLYLNLRDYELI